MAKPALVSVVIVPVSGEPQTKEFVLPEGGATVADALKALDISAENKNITVGRGAKAGTKLSEGDIVTVQLTAGTKLTVGERPRGS